jgi:hypothetical protein
MEQVSTAAIIAMFVTLAICIVLPVGFAADLSKENGKRCHFSIPCRSFGFFCSSGCNSDSCLQGLSLLDGFGDFVQNHFWTYAAFCWLFCGTL